MSCASHRGTPAAALVAAAAAAVLTTVAAPCARAVTVAANPNASWPAAVFSPYVDIAGWPPPQVDQMMSSGGSKYVTLAFLTASGGTGTDATWGGYSAYPIAGTSTPGDLFSTNLITGINNLRAAGGDVMASFGGQTGTPIEANYAPGQAALVAQQYENAVNTYHLNAIDEDVEGNWVQNNASTANSILLRSQALALTQQADPSLKVWFTLPVEPSGLDANALNILGSALTNGVKIGGVNVMTMDFGDANAPNPAGQMGAYAIAAANATHAQLIALYAQHGKTLSDAQAWAMQGITPRIGVGDSPDYTDEVFTSADAQTVLSFAQAHGLGYLSFWNENRDADASTGASSTPYAFSQVYNAYNVVAPSAVAWASAGGGSWATAGNWSPATAVPNAAGAAVTFGPAMTTARTVTLDGSRTVGKITFSGTHAYTIAAGTGGTLAINDTGGAPAITVTAGSHAISAPITLAAGATVTTASGTGLTIAGPLGGSGTLTVAGAGTVTFAANPSTTTLVRATPALAIGSGATVAVATGTGRTLLAPAALTVAGSAGAWTGHLNLGANDLDVPAGSLSTLNSLAAAGFAGGAWSGPGLASTAAAADARHLTAVGVVQNGSLYASFDGRAVASTDVLARYTYYGDANLDGSVTAADYTRIDAGYVQHLSGWANGDLNYDGVVDGSDYTLADNAFNAQPRPLGAPAAVAAPLAAVAAVPEPAMLAPLAVAAALSGRRRTARRA